MLQQSEHRPYGELDDRLHDAHALTAELFRDVIDETCSRLRSIRLTESAARIERLIKSDAWTDAVLALIEIELPQWRIRRLAYDEGEWHCALSQARELPEWLDQSIEACHADLPLAILSAFVAARQVTAPLDKTSVPTVRRERTQLYEPVCCDNFA